VLQCVAVCCSVLQSVAGNCIVLQCVEVCCSVLQCVALSMMTDKNSLISTQLQGIAGYCSVLQGVAVSRTSGENSESQLHSHFR